MTAYAVAHLREVNFGPAIIEYLERIDATLAPYRGRFLIHGAQAHALEGRWRGDLVVVEFPSLEHARAWYHSPAYQRILGLRTGNAVGDTFLVEGVPPGYRATAVVHKRRRAHRKDPQRAEADGS
jgi:uncharacterized protein (DUF1330 family)